MRMSLRQGAAVFSWVAVIAAATLSSGGCIVQTSDDSNCDCGTGGTGGGATPSEVKKAMIDVDQTLSTTPGQGIGVFIEYLAGGRWHLFVACDTALSGLSCAHEVWVTVPPSASFGGVKKETLEGLDTIDEYTDGLRLATETAEDIDGVFFETDPGVTVQFEVWLDGVQEGRYVYWVGGGAVHAGAPSNPLDLVPSGN